MKLYPDIKGFIELDRIPSSTSQQKGVQIVHGRPHFYTKKTVQAAKDLYTVFLKGYRPPEPMKGPVRVRVSFYYPAKRPHKEGEPKTTRGDLDNLGKAFLDVMTDLGFWIDDAQIAQLTLTKSYARTCGIYFEAEEIELRGTEQCHK